MQISMSNAGRWAIGAMVALLAGCGAEDLSPGAIVLGPQDGTITHELAGTSVAAQGALVQTFAPLEFRVVGADGRTPMEGITIRFYGGVQIRALTYRDGTPLNPADPLFFETTTDERGLSPVDIFVSYFVPPCKADVSDPQAAGPDTTVTAAVEASIGVASKRWTLTIVSQGGAAVSGCVPSP